MAMKYIKLFEGWKLMEAEDDVTEFNSSKPGLTPVLQTTIKNFNDAVDDNRYERLIESLLKRAKQTGGAFDPEAGKEETAIELEVAFEDLVETLQPTGHFDPGEWLYQQLCLAMPQRQLCDSLCQGIQLSPQPEEPSEPSSDRRWASLESLKNHLSN